MMQIKAVVNMIYSNVYQLAPKVTMVQEKKMTDEHWKHETYKAEILSGSSGPNWSPQL